MPYSMDSPVLRPRSDEGPHSAQPVASAGAATEDDRCDPTCLDMAVASPELFLCSPSKCLNFHFRIKAILFGKLDG